jgi:hypothetical protein
MDGLNIFYVIFISLHTNQIPLRIICFQVAHAFFMWKSSIIPAATRGVLTSCYVFSNKKGEVVNNEVDMLHANIYYNLLILVG